MKYALYDILLHVTVAALTPYFAFKMLTARKYRRGIPERFGLIGEDKVRKLSGGKAVWIHAVSVGEAKAVMPVLRLLRERNPGLRVAFSTVTATGNDVALREGSALIDALIFFPLDLSWAVKRVIGKINPAAFVVVEKEVWPNLFKALHDSKVPIIVVNGTISERSYGRFLKFRRVFGGVFAMVSFFCARTEEDRKRAVDSGVPPERARTTGNIKFDLKTPEARGTHMEALRSALGIAEDDLVIVAGSTHRGEEEIILRAFERILGEFGDARLVLAPRHPERFDEVESLIRKRGLDFSRRSRGGGGRVVILDTVGELIYAYGLAAVALVGGSLVEGIGGHNLLEPALYDKPVLYGRHLTTYRYMAELIEEGGGGMAVDGEEGLYRALKEVLSDEELRRRMGEAAGKVVTANRGAALRTVEVIEGFLKG